MSGSHAIPNLFAVAVVVLILIFVPIKRDPFEMSWGDEKKANFWFSGALAGPVTGYIYDWNLLPIGQALWLKELETYQKYPPLQDPASYNLTQVLEQIKKMTHPSE
jgi:arylsulfatase